MMGTVDGISKKIITNISVTMSHNFADLMAILQAEARDGRFSTKADAVRKRDELIKAKPADEVQAETAAPPAGEVTSIAQAETADSQPGRQ